MRLSRKGWQQTANSAKIWFRSPIARLEFVTRDNGLPRGFDGRKVPSSQQLVTGEIPKAEGVVGKTVFGSKRMGFRRRSDADGSHTCTLPRYQKTSGIIRTWIPGG